VKAQLLTLIEIYSCNLLKGEFRAIIKSRFYYFLDPVPEKEGLNLGLVPKVESIISKIFHLKYKNCFNYEYLL
jgi:hypothetical protein